MTTSATGSPTGSPNGTPPPSPPPSPRLDVRGLVQAQDQRPAPPPPPDISDFAAFLSSRSGKTWPVVQAAGTYTGSQKLMLDPFSPSPDESKKKSDLVKNYIGDWKSEYQTDIEVTMVQKSGGSPEEIEAAKVKHKQARQNEADSKRDLEDYDKEISRSHKAITVLTDVNTILIRARSLEDGFQESHSSIPYQPGSPQEPPAISLTWSDPFTSMSAWLEDMEKTWEKFKQELEKHKEALEKREQELRRKQEKYRLKYVEKNKPVPGDKQEKIMQLQGKVTDAVETVETIQQRLDSFINSCMPKLGDIFAILEAWKQEIDGVVGAQQTQEKRKQEDDAEMSRHRQMRDNKIPPRDSTPADFEARAKDSGKTESKPPKQPDYKGTLTRIKVQAGGGDKQEVLTQAMQVVGTFRGPIGGTGPKRPGLEGLFEKPSTSGLPPDDQPLEDEIKAEAEQLVKELVAGDPEDLSEEEEALKALEGAIGGIDSDDEEGDDKASGSGRSTPIFTSAPPSPKPVRGASPSFGSGSQASADGDGSGSDDKTEQ